MFAKDEVLQGRYRIIRQLGHGGMGAVYEARDERLGSSVALKEIIVELDKIPTEKQREHFLRAFEREARLLANLHHEAFPRVMDYFSEENRQFLIMELIHGDDLGVQLDKAKKPFPLEDTLKWIDQLLDALDYLHTQTPPIYHRDIKPQNLKVNLRGKIKLLDFGIAKSVDNAGSTMTNHTFVGATLNYSPIEQILPAITATFREFIILKHNDKAEVVLNQTTNAQCDIYAVGATFYHLLTDTMPVDSAKRSLEIWEGNPDPLPHPSKLNPQIPPAISAVLLKALEIDRENRFATALEMQESLQRAIRLEKDRRQAEEAEARRKFNEEKTLPFINPHLPAADQAKQLDQDQSHLKTEPIVPKREIRLGTKKDYLDNNPAASNPSIETQHSNVEFSPFRQPITDSTPIDVPNTQPAGSVSQPEAISPPYFDNNQVVNIPIADEKREFVRVPPVTDPAVEPKPTGMPFWLIPVAAVIVLLVGSVGALVWIVNSNPTSEVKTTANQTNSNSSTAATNVSTNTSPKVSPSLSPTSSPTQSSAATTTTDEKTKPAAVPTQAKPVVQNTPRPKPTTQVQSPQTSSKPDLSDDCVYNGRCRKN